MYLPLKHIRIPSDPKRKGPPVAVGNIIIYHLQSIIYETDNLNLSQSIVKWSGLLEGQNKCGLLFERTMVG